MCTMQLTCILHLTTVFFLVCLNARVNFAQESPSQNHSETEIKKVFVVFRHGDRAPHKIFGETYPNDPYRDAIYYPEGEGQLINAGKLRSYELGQILRKRYDTFLGNIYNPREVEARSTLLVRCKMTLQLVLASLYPPTLLQQWHPSLKWQPVDVTYWPNTNDGFLLPYLCPLYVNASREIFNDPEVKAALVEFDKFKKELSMYTGKRIRTPMDASLLYQTLVSQANLNLTLPSWTKQYFPNGKLTDSAVLFLKLQNTSKKQKRLTGGILLKKMIEEMKVVINKTRTAKKIHLYSCHDINVASLLIALNVFNNSPPNYTSAVIIELHERRKQYYVKVLYYLGIPQETVELQIPGCATLCHFKDFLRLTEDVLPLPSELTCVPPEQMFI